MHDYPIAVYALYLVGCLAATYALSQAVARDEADGPRGDDPPCALCGGPYPLTGARLFVDDTNRRRSTLRPVCAECARVGVAA